MPTRFRTPTDVTRTAVIWGAPRPHRHGVAARIALDLPASWRDRIPAWLAPGFEPLVSLGGAWDRQFISFESSFYDESDLGVELGLGNVVFMRLGCSSTQSGYEHTLWGYGLALPLGRLGGLRYDESRMNEYPEPRGHAWSVWVSPLEIARALR
jgi:hypothetical protein